ncbi:MAG: T9SS type A sorting domain-containing protein [Bacteroidia bacterium]|jgi:hypothetical protein|nr:T9SS type A sorting domain-containing protein [Bacteroidia bacterium]
MRILFLFTLFFTLNFTAAAQNCSVDVSYTINGNQIIAVANDSNAVNPYFYWLDPVTNTFTTPSSNNSYTFTLPPTGNFYTCVWMVDTVTPCSDTACLCICPATGCTASFYTFDSLNITFFVNTSTADSGSTFVWDFGDQTFSFDAFPSHTYAQSGFYNVCMVILDSMQMPCDTVCQQISVLYQVQPSVAEINQLPGGVKVFPNPAGQAVNINWEQTTSSPHQITIYDLTGRIIIATLNTPVTTGVQTVSLPLSDIPGGVYLVKIEDEQGRQAVTRLTVQTE